MNRRSMVTVSLLSVDTRSCIWQISKAPLNAIFDCKLLQPFLQSMSLGTQFSCFLRFGDNLIQVQEWCSCSVMYTHSRPCDHCNTLITWNSSVNTGGNIIIIYIRLLARHITSKRNPFVHGEVQTLELSWYIISWNGVHIHQVRIIQSTKQLQLISGPHQGTSEELSGASIQRDDRSKAKTHDKSKV
jgi:hypothetical protein